MSTIQKNLPSTRSHTHISVLHVCTVGITARVFLIPLLATLQDCGYEVTLACSPDDDARHLSAHGIPHVPVSISRSIHPSDIIAVIRLYRYIRRQRCTIVHTHTSKAGFIGRVGTLLGEHNINIATWRTGRSAPGGLALSFISVDSDVPDEVVKAILEFELVMKVNKIQL